MLHGSCIAPLTIILIAWMAMLEALATEAMDEPFHADCDFEDGSVSMLQKRALHSAPHSSQAHHHAKKVHHNSRQRKKSPKVHQRKKSPKVHHDAKHSNSTQSHKAHHKKQSPSWHKAAHDIANGMFSAAGVSVGSAAVLAGLAPGLSFAELAGQASTTHTKSLVELASHEIEFEFSSGANKTLMPHKSKVVLALLEGFFLPACLGVDRCYMGQPCIGTIKGLTLGGFFVWYLIDYIFIGINMFMQETYVNRLGFSACFGPGAGRDCFDYVDGPSEVRTAFYITAAFILIKCFFIVFGGRWGGKQIPGDQTGRAYESDRPPRLPHIQPPAIDLP